MLGEKIIQDKVLQELREKQKMEMDKDFIREEIYYMESKLARIHQFGIIYEEKFNDVYKFEYEFEHELDKQYDYKFTSKMTIGKKEVKIRLETKKSYYEIKYPRDKGKLRIHRGGFSAYKKGISKIEMDELIFLVKQGEILIDELEKHLMPPQPEPTPEPFNVTFNPEPRQSAEEKDCHTCGWSHFNNGTGRHCDDFRKIKGFSENNCHGDDYISWMSIEDVQRIPREKEEEKTDTTCKNCMFFKGIGEYCGFGGVYIYSEEARCKKFKPKWCTHENQDENYCDKCGEKLK